MRKLLLGCFALFSIFSSYSAKAQLNGTYTIGGATPDYVDIMAACTDIMAVGISGPVTFNIRPGYYSTDVNIYNYTFANTITFQSETGNADDVLFRLMSIYGSRRITFKNVSWNPVVNTSALYPYKGMEIAGSFNILFDSCKIIGTSSSLSRNAISILRSRGFIEIRNCSFKNLDNGVSFSANTHFGSRKHDDFNCIEDCTFDSVDAPIRISGEIGNSSGDTMSVKRNTIEHADYGIIVDGQYGNLSSVFVEKNNVINATVVGIKVYYTSPSTSSRPVTLRNNMVSGGSVSHTTLSGSTTFMTRTTIDVDETPFIVVENNSVLGSIRFQDVGTATVTGNSIASDSLASLWGYNIATITSDYNNLYSEYSPLVAWLNSIAYPTVDSIQSYSGNEMHSISVAPWYVSNTDLHSYSPYMQFAGTPLPNVNDDIDLETRDAVAPDIGADEYHASPLPPFAWFDYTCIGGTAIQFNNVSVRDTASSWDFGDGNFSTSLSPSHTYASAGAYVIVLIVTNTYGLDTFNFTITFPMAPSITIVGSVLSVPATFTTYQWYLNGTAIIGATSNSYTATINGSYTIEVTQGVGCPAMSLPATINVGIEEDLLQGGVAVLPNPASDKLFVVLAKQYEKVLITLVDALGKTVCELTSQSEKMEIDTKELSEGVYFLRIQTEDFVETKKILIVK